jgi:hypothetical protein
MRQKEQGGSLKGVTSEIIARSSVDDVGIECGIDIGNNGSSRGHRVPDA